MNNIHLVDSCDVKLRTKCRNVRSAEFGWDLHSYTECLAVEMYTRDGIGIAAPQVGDLRRIIIVDKDCMGFALKRFINPSIVNHSTTQSLDNECCLSFEGLIVPVSRYDWIEIEYCDTFGATRRDVFMGRESRILQHEIDHLDGITLLDKQFVDCAEEMTA